MSIVGKMMKKKHPSPTADLLRKAIRESGKSVNSIAKAIHISQPGLCRFTNGRQGLSMETADAVLEHIGMTLILSYAGNP